MKTIVTALIFLALNNSMFPQKKEASGFYQSNDDSIAHSTIEKNLEVIKKYTQAEKDTIVVDLGNIIGFLIELTGIAPDSFYDNVPNPYTPSKNDYRRWETWYIANRNIIHWDNENKKITFKKALFPYVPINRQ